MFSRAEVFDMERRRNEQDEAKLRRTMSFEDEMARNPGARPGSSGPTGIGRTSGFAGAPSIGGTGVHAERAYDALQERQGQYALDTGTRSGPSGYGGGTMRGGTQYGGGGQAPAATGGGDGMAELQAILAGMGGGGAGPDGAPRPGPGSSGMGPEIDALQRQLASFPGMHDVNDRMDANRNAPGTPNAEMAAMRAAGLGEDMLDMSSERGADRYFEEGATMQRGQEFGNAMDMMTAENEQRYGGPARSRADASMYDTDMQGYADAAGLELDAGAEEFGQSNDLLSTLGELGVDPEDPRMAGLIEALMQMLGQDPGGGGGF